MNMKKKLIPSSALELCYRNRFHDQSSGTVLGVVLKGISADQTVIFPMRGRMAPPPDYDLEIYEEGRRNHESWVFASINKNYPKCAFVDATHFPPCSVLPVKKGFFRKNKPHPMLEKMSPPNRGRVIGMVMTDSVPNSGYANQRALLFFRLRHRILHEDIGLTEYNKRLQEELEQMEYWFRPEDDKLMVSGNWEIKEKIGRFPDLANALALTQCYTPN